jgi:hypothetical protein
MDKNNVKTVGYVGFNDALGEAFSPRSTSRLRAQDSADRQRAIRTGTPASRGRH